MDFEKQYLSELDYWGHEAESLTNNRATRAPQLNLLQASIEFMDANLFHVLRLADRQYRLDLLRSAVHALLTNRNVDHVPAYTGKLCDYVEVSDPGSILNDVSRGRSFMFLGFHTGPYWTIFKKLIEKGVDVITLFPPALEQKRHEIAEGIAAMKDHFSSPSIVKLVSLDDPAFLVQLRSGLGKGTQIVVYLDGNSGTSLQKSSKRDVTVPFFHSQIVAKTTIFRVAHMLGLPVVTFNSVRHGIKRSLFLEPPPQQARSNELAAQDTYGSLCARLDETPSQWEGWLYFHNYFTAEYRASLVGNAQSYAAACLDRDTRYFRFDIGGESTIVDKQTYKQYRTRTKSENLVAA
jgi:predicted LPLAT superfamily acyltransferase